MNNQTNIHEQTVINKAWNPKTSKWDVSFTFVFQNKEQYLAFRQLWKQNYRELSAMIRSRKAAMRALMRSREYAGSLQSEARALGAKATVELMLLAAAKHEAGRQYLAGKEIEGRKAF